MRGKITWIALCTAAMLMAEIYLAKTVQATAATPPPGFVGTTVARGTFSPLQVFNHASKDMLPAGNDDNVWLSLQKTQGRSDLYIQSNTWQPVTNNTVASTGWHTHPGHSLIIVTAGTITEYEDDCTPHVYQKGDTLVDPGNGHVHIIRNEGTVLASTMVVQLVPYDPAKMNRRIDAPAPENCSSIN